MVCAHLGSAPGGVAQQECLGVNAVGGLGQLGPDRGRAASNRGHRLEQFYSLSCSALTLLHPGLAVPAEDVSWRVGMLGALQMSGLPSEWPQVGQLLCTQWSNPIGPAALGLMPSLHQNRACPAQSTCLMR